jgi:hypothetical protein
MVVIKNPVSRVMKMIDLTKASTVFIGRRGEHNFRNLEFDVSRLLDGTYPGAALTYSRHKHLNCEVTKNEFAKVNTNK